MKISRPFFKSLSARERTLSMNHSLAGLLNTTLREMSKQVELTPLQYNFLVTEVGYVYQHFGFSVFGPKASRFLASQLSVCAGVPEPSIRTWLETIGYMLLEDFNILKVVTGEPDWESVDKAFFRDFARRVLCAEVGESGDLGLDAWNDALIGRLCANTSSWVDRAQYEQVEAILPEVVECVQDSPFGVQIATAIGESLELIADNFLQLLIWRVQFLTSFADIRQEAKFIIRGDSEEQEQLAARFAALLALFIPQESDDGTLLLPASPLAVTTLATVLRSDHESPYFDCGLFRNWLDLHDGTLKRDLDMLMHQARDVGLLFEVPKGKNSRGYGLTLSALRIVSPFREAISKALMRAPFELEHQARLSV